MVTLLFAAAAGALISAIWDDGDESMVATDQSSNQPELTLRQKALYGQMAHKYPEASDQELMDLARGVVKINEAKNFSYWANEISMVGRVLYDNDYDASRAEIDRVRLVYGYVGGVDDKVSRKDYKIYNSLDPADDGDDETDDAFSFETEIENIFGAEQMAISEEDIQSESDIRDPSSVDPYDEISQDEEIEVGDTTTGVDSEIAVTEEVFFQEAVIYPDLGDLDIDPTDDNDDLYVPDDSYRPQEEIEARIEWMEDFIDDAEEQLNANTFESMARTFHQDDSDQVMMMDDPYFDGVVDNDLVIDFSSLTDDATAIATDLIDDTFGNKFFEWIQAPGTESLDIDPAPGFMSPYGIIGGMS